MVWWIVRPCCSTACRLDGYACPGDLLCLWLKKLNDNKFIRSFYHLQPRPIFFKRSVRLDCGRKNKSVGARLHISGLRAASGPRIEFLEYASPLRTSMNLSA
jgi:hypothetical protein